MNINVRKRGRRRGRSWSAAVLDKVEELHERGMSAVAIAKELEHLQGKGDLPAADALPSARSILNIIAELPVDASGPWHVSETEDEADLPLLCDVLAEVISLSQGKSTLTNGEAGWCRTLRRAGCDVPPNSLWRLARQLLAAESRDGPRVALDAFVAFRPWAGMEERERYEAALDKGWVEAPSSLLLDFARSLAVQNAARNVRGWRAAEGETVKEYMARTDQEGDVDREEDN